MENYNNVPTKGTISGMVSAINSNFALTKEMLERLQLTKDKSQGLFASASSLNAKIPSPSVGDWALVGTDSPFAVYVCETAGTWTDSGGEYGEGSIDLSDYATKDEVEEVSDAVAKAPTADADDEYDLAISDEQGYKLVGFKNGHIKTKNFDSSQIKEPVDTDTSEADLDINDDQGYTLVRFEGGHIKTKNFDSSAANSVTTDDGALADMDIKDENGYVLARFEDGHIKTKNFDSSDIQATGSGKPYPLTGSPQKHIAPVSSLNAQLTDFVQGHYWGTGSVSYLYGLYDALVTAHPEWVKKETDIGMDASNTFAMRHYTIRMQTPKVIENRTAENPTNVYSDTVFQPRRILLSMGMHAGNKAAGEPWSLFGGYLAVKEIVESEEDWAMFLKRNFVIDVVPCINPWAMEVGLSAQNSNGVNLNRDFDTAAGSRQQETTNMINLIQDLMTKGLVAVLDTHNSGQSAKVGYLISKPTYKTYNYAVQLTQELKPIIGEIVDAVNAKNVTFIGDKDFFTFNYAANPDATGQMHEYADSQGLMAMTVESANCNYSWCLTQTLVCNILQAMGIAGITAAGGSGGGGGGTTDSVARAAAAAAQNTADTALSTAQAALPSSKIWVGTAAEYELLTTAQKEAVIAFITETSQSS